MRNRPPRRPPLFEHGELFLGERREVPLFEGEGSYEGGDAVHLTTEITEAARHAGKVGHMLHCGGRDPVAVREWMTDHTPEAYFAINFSGWNNGGRVALHAIFPTPTQAMESKLRWG